MTDRNYRRWMMTAALAAILAAATITAGQKKVSTEVLMQTAIQKESVDGDLKGAIDIYKKVAESSDRALAAKALIRMAECYRKLGDSESRKIYERVIRDFADQKESVAIAKAGLGGAPSSTSMSQRPVWTDKRADLPEGFRRTADTLRTQIGPLARLHCTIFAPASIVPLSATD
jgi:tetratricopeptide (TPR) repeat protein